MNPTLKRPVATTQYYLEDWLLLHDLTSQACMRALGTSLETHTPHEPRFTNLTVEEAWDLIADAMASKFPEQVSLIRIVQDHTRVEVSGPPKGAKPVTIDPGNGQYPVVLHKYQPTMGGLLTLAHEFGHALQIMACKHKFVPPVLRETSAFLAELILLAHLRLKFPGIHADATRAWAAQNTTYLGEHRTALVDALGDQNAQYCYDWNYPIARIAASAGFETLTSDELWAIFKDQIELSGLLKFFGCGFSGHQGCSRACIKNTKILEMRA